MDCVAYRLTYPLGIMHEVMCVRNRCGRNTSCSVAVQLSLVHAINIVCDCHLEQYGEVSGIKLILLPAAERTLVA